jgi:hypothetical protein
MKNFESKIANVNNSIGVDEFEELKRSSINDRADTIVKIDQVFTHKTAAITKSDFKEPSIKPKNLIQETQSSKPVEEVDVKIIKELEFT